MLEVKHTQSRYGCFLRLGTTYQAKKKQVVARFDNRIACFRERRLTSFKDLIACEEVGRAFRAGKVTNAVEYETPYAPEEVVSFKSKTTRRSTQANEITNNTRLTVSIPKETVPMNLVIVIGHGILMIRGGSSWTG